MRISCTAICRSFLFACFYLIAIKYLLWFPCCNCNLTSNLCANFVKLKSERLKGKEKSLEKRYLNEEGGKNQYGRREKNGLKEAGGKRTEKSVIKGKKKKEKNKFNEWRET